MIYLTTHSTHFIYGYMASDIWLRTILIVREETRCRHIGYSFRLAARVLLYAPSHRQDSTYHGLCYTSRGGCCGCNIAKCRIYFVVSMKNSGPKACLCHVLVNSTCSLILFTVINWWVLFNVVYIPCLITTPLSNSNK